MMHYLNQVVIATIGFFECLFANNLDVLLRERGLLGLGVRREVWITIAGAASLIEVIVGLPEQILQGKINEIGTVLLEE